MQDNELLLRHRRLVATQTIDDHNAALLLLDASAYTVRELAWRQFRCVHLLDEQLVGIAHSLEINAEVFSTGDQKPDLFIKNEHGGSLAPRYCSRNELEHQKGFACAGWSHNQRARSSSQSTTQ